jgi:hypothetical protein
MTRSQERFAPPTSGGGLRPPGPAVANFLKRHFFLFGGRRHFRRIFSTFLGQFSKLYFFLFSLFRSDLSIMENFFSPDEITDTRTHEHTHGKLIFTRPSLRLVRVSKSHCVLSVRPSPLKEKEKEEEANRNRPPCTALHCSAVQCTALQ